MILSPCVRFSTAGWSDGLVHHAINRHWQRIVRTRSRWLSLLCTFMRNAMHTLH